MYDVMQGVTRPYRFLILLFWWYQVPMRPYVFDFVMQHVNELPSLIVGVNVTILVLWALFIFFEPSPQSILPPRILHPRIRPSLSKRCCCSIYCCKGCSATLSTPYVWVFIIRDYALQHLIVLRFCRAPECNITMVVCGLVRGQNCTYSTHTHIFIRNAFCSNTQRSLFAKTYIQMRTVQHKNDINTLGLINTWSNKKRNK